MVSSTDLTNMVNVDFVKPTPISFETVEVRIDATGFEGYIREFVAYAMMSGVPEIPLTEEELREYIETLVYLRVAWVRGWRPPVRPYDRFAVPAFVAVALAAVGEAEDARLGVRLVPHTDCKPMDLNKFWQVSRKLFALANRGFTMSEGLVRDHNGDWDTMCIHLIGQDVVCHNMDPHPSKAVVAAALNLRWVNAVLNPRVKYGHTEEFATVLRHLAAPRHLN
jgi:hypothetical protein